MDWVRACKEDADDRTLSASDFSEAGPFNEMVVMGVLAVRLQGLNQELHWDGDEHAFHEHPRRRHDQDGHQGRFPASRTDTPPSTRRGPIRSTPAVRPGAHQAQLPRRLEAARHAAVNPASADSETENTVNVKTLDNQKEYENRPILFIGMQQRSDLHALASLRWPRGGKAKTAETRRDAKTTARKPFPNTPSSTTPQVDLATFPQDKDGYYVIFDGKTFNGWRGYGKDKRSGRVDDRGRRDQVQRLGRRRSADGRRRRPDLRATSSRTSNSNWSGRSPRAATRVSSTWPRRLTTEKDGKTKCEPIYISSPEYQVLDNENHPDAKLGVDGNRKSASLYDMIPAVPQNAKPFGEWNKAKIMVYKGTVVHGQNGQNVVEYHLWTPQWTEMLENSKFTLARSGRWHSSCSTTAAARTTRATSACRTTATTSGSATSASRCSTKRPFVR